MKVRYLAQLAILTVAWPLSAAQTQEAPQASPASLVCNRVRFLPAPGNERAMIGGKFEGSNVSRRDGFQTLAEIKTAPPAGQWGELTFDNTKVYRWLRYVGPTGAQGKPGKIEFYAPDCLLAGQEQR